MLHCTPFLLFDGNCAEAMNFYQQCLGGKLTLTKLDDTPMRKQFPAEKRERIINAQLQSNEIYLTATDWMASPSLEPLQGNTVALYLTGDSFDELITLFDKLAAGADKATSTFIKLHDMPFGTYGQLTDKYGVSWIFKGENKNIDSAVDKSYIVI